MGESNTVVSTYTLYRHLQEYCSHLSIRLIIIIIIIIIIIFRGLIIVIIELRKKDSKKERKKDRTQETHNYDPDALSMFCVLLC